MCMSGSNGRRPILFNGIRDQRTQFGQVLQDMVGPPRLRQDTVQGIIAWALDGCADKYIAWIPLSTFPAYLPRASSLTCVGMCALHTPHY